MVFVVLTLSIAIAVLGAVGLVVPTVLLAVSQPFLSPAGLYVAAGLRLVLGAALLVTAPTSRAPQTLKMLGVVIIVAGLATPLIGVDRARVIVEWLTTQGPALMRVWAGFALGFGLFLAYAVAPPRPRSDRL